MNWIWIIGIIAGAIIGWVGTYGVREDRRWNVLSNMIVGGIGGAVGVWFFNTLLGIQASTTTGDNWLAILWGAIGGAVFMAVLDVVLNSMTETRYEDTLERGRSYPHEYDDDETKRNRKNR